MTGEANDPVLMYFFFCTKALCCIFSFRVESGEEELFNIGREFDERYHWHSLKPLSDDYDRTKKTLTGKDERKRLFFIFLDGS